MNATPAPTDARRVNGQPCACTDRAACLWHYDQQAAQTGRTRGRRDRRRGGPR